MTNDVLLKVEPADYARLISSRRKAAVLPVLLCTALAAAIIAFDYRLMLISFVIFVPALVALLEVVMISRSAKALGSCDVRCEGEWLTLNERTRVRIGAISSVIIQPDSLRLVEQLGPQRFRGHLLASDEGAAQRLIARLASLGRPLKHEKTTIVTLMAFLWGVMANLLLEAAAAVLMLGAIGYTGKGLMSGDGPGWEALACFLGAVASVTAVILIRRYTLKQPAR